MAKNPLLIKINADVRKENMGRVVWFKYPIDHSREHYQLLRFISKQLPPNSKVTDLGTKFSESSISFADANPKIQVVSYDITAFPPILNLEEIHATNLTYILKDATQCVEEYIDSTLIMLDISVGSELGAPHDGLQEKVIFDKLIQNNFKGLLLCDDIHSNDGMKKFWNDIPLTKYDITQYGHIGNYGQFGDGGTGIVVFAPEAIDVEVT